MSTEILEIVTEIAKIRAYEALYSLALGIAFQLAWTSICLLQTMEESNSNNFREVMDQFLVGIKNFTICQNQQ